MGQCVTLSVGNTGATVLPSEGSGGGTTISNNMGGGGEEEEEEEEEGCLDMENCFPCI
tara:strand:+ start:1092 stop:1265 length:174 start_codon:yes stop_codon:yes gene_type:complete